jgi:hypothetical protein
MQRVKLVLMIHQGGLELALYQRRWQGWALKHEAVVDWPEGSADTTLSELLATAIRPLQINWGIKPGLSVLAVPNQAQGGVLSTLVDRNLALAEQINTLLERRLPYSRTELAHCHRLHGSDPHQTVTVAWIAQGWLNELADALDRLGLRLDEAFPVAFLLQHAREGVATQRNIWMIQHANQLGLWSLPPSGPADGLASLDIKQPDFAQRLKLAWFGLAGADTPALVASGLLGEVATAAAALSSLPARTLAAPRLTELAFLQWQAGAEGWWRAPSKDWLIARFTPWLIALAALLVAAVATTSWQRQKLTDGTAKLESTADKLRPNYRRLETKERELLHMRGTMIEAESFKPHGGLLNALAITTSVLPSGSWVSHYHADPRGSVVEGFGIDNAKLKSALASKGWLASPPVEPTPTTTKPAAAGAKDKTAPATGKPVANTADSTAKDMPANTDKTHPGKPSDMAATKPTTPVAADKPLGKTDTPAPAAPSDETAPAARKPDFKLDIHERPVAKKTSQR